MSTFDQLTQNVLANLQGFSVDQDQITTLTGSINASDLTLPVASPDEVSRGLAEIGDELLWVKAVDRTAMTATVIPGGRGWQNTTAGSHSVDAVVKNNPKFPRADIKRSINDTIRACYPDLWRLKSTTFTFSPVVSTYSLPAEVEDIYDVTWDEIGPSEDWPRLRRWRFMPNANVTDFPTGKAIQLLQPAFAGRSVQVSYMVSPQVLSAGTDDFSAVSGLPASAEDVVTYGACYRLSGYLDVPRLQAQAVEGSNRAPLTQPGAATNVAKYFYALYQERLQQEREILLGRYPRVTHMTRR